MSKQDKEELVRVFVKVPKSKKEMIQKVVEKTSYNTASDLIRAGIDKELNIQMYKDNLEVILQEISKCIDCVITAVLSENAAANCGLNSQIPSIHVSAINTVQIRPVACT